MRSKISNRFKCSDCGREYSVPRHELDRSSSPRCPSCGSTAKTSLPPIQRRKPKVGVLRDFNMLRRLCRDEGVKMPSGLKRAARKERLKDALEKAGYPGCALCPKPAKWLVDGAWLCGMHADEARKEKRKGK